MTFLLFYQQCDKFPSLPQLHKSNVFLNWNGKKKTCQKGSLLTDQIISMDVQRKISIFIEFIQLNNIIIDIWFADLVRCSPGNFISRSADSNNTGGDFKWNSDIFCLRGSQQKIILLICDTSTTLMVLPNIIQCKTKKNKQTFKGPILCNIHLANGLYIS